KRKSGSANREKTCNASSLISKFSLRSNACTQISVNFNELLAQVDPLRFFESSESSHRGKERMRHAFTAALQMRKSRHRSGNGARRVEEAK
ncbi:MAG: hypothetical protein M3R40_04755, partial [Pseudomonadota bacterium]|nr:hypothetical protein [Pseudomonadota bacterium]